MATQLQVQIETINNQYSNRDLEKKRLLAEYAKELATAIKDIYNISVGWKGFDRAKKRIGCCHYKGFGNTVTSAQVSISKHYMKIMDGAELRDTVLHEYAHALAALVDNETGHGHMWKKWCRKIGANPSRLKKVDGHVKKYIKQLATWALECPTCGKRNYYHRRPKDNKACGKCCGGTYDPKHKFELKKL